MMGQRLFLIILSFGIFINTNGQLPFYKGNYIKEKAAKDDLALLHQILKKNHPSYNWYTPTATIDQIFTETINGIKDSISEIDFALKANYCIGFIKCGHTVLFLPKKSAAAINKGYTRIFPMGFLPYKDTLLVLYNNTIFNNEIRRGTKVVGINGVSSKLLIDSLSHYFSGDGYAEIYRERRLGNNFPFIHRNVFGLSKQYEVSYINQKNELATVKVSVFPPMIDSSIKPKIKQVDTVIKKTADTLRLSNAKSDFKPDSIAIKNEIENKVRIEDKKDTTPSKITTIKTPSKNNTPNKRKTKKALKLARFENVRKIEIDTSLSMAYITLNSFKGARLRKFYRKQFKKIKELKIQHLVLDVRDNGGGYINKYILLTKYLASKKFKVADTVSASTRKLFRKGLMKQGFWNNLFLKFFTKKRADGRYHITAYEKKWRRIKKRNHFDGAIYIINGYSSFSATTLLGNNLKGQSNVTIVGDETGGAHYGNSGVLLPTLTLPNTKMQLTMPLFRVVINSKVPFNGRGIMPDEPAIATPESLQQGLDVKKQKVLSLIKQRLGKL
jgi:C-terminal processing protease CtpA/Prc